MTLMRDTAAYNSGVYDELDGGTSAYRCKTLDQLSTQLKSTENKSYHDLRIRDIAGSIKGYLVFFPLDFLSDSLGVVRTSKNSCAVTSPTLWI